MNQVRVGKPRSHREGISLDIFYDTGSNPKNSDSVKPYTAYGADEYEARFRAGIAGLAYAGHLGAEYKP